MIEELGSGERRKRCDNCVLASVAEVGISALACQRDECGAVSLACNNRDLYSSSLGVSVNQLSHRLNCARSFGIGIAREAFGINESDNGNGERIAESYEARDLGAVVGVDLICGLIYGNCANGSAAESSESGVGSLAEISVKLLNAAAVENSLSLRSGVFACRCGGHIKFIHRYGRDIVLRKSYEKLLSSLYRVLIGICKNSSRAVFNGVFGRRLYACVRRTVKFCVLSDYSKVSGLSEHCRSTGTNACNYRYLGNYSRKIGHPHEQLAVSRESLAAIVKICAAGIIDTYHGNARFCRKVIHLCDLISLHFVESALIYGNVLRKCVAWITFNISECGHCAAKSFARSSVCVKLGKLPFVKKICQPCFCSAGSVCGSLELCKIGHSFSHTISSYQEKIRQLRKAARRADCPATHLGKRRAATYIYYNIFHRFYQVENEDYKYLLRLHL